MTTTRFIRDTDQRTVRCMGGNHRDEGQKGRCGSCGAQVVRLTNGRLLELHVRHTAADSLKIDYRCWQPAHECDEARALLWQAEQDDVLDSGAIVVGQDVTVVRGRKVAKGTRGIIRWMGEGDYGLRLGLAVEGTNGLVYIAATNVEPTPR